MTSVNVEVIPFFILLVALGGLGLAINQLLIAKKIEELQRKLDHLRRKLDDGLPHEYWGPEEADS